MSTRETNLDFTFLLIAKLLSLKTLHLVLIVSVSLFHGYEEIHLMERMFIGYILYNIERVYLIQLF